MTVTTRIRLRYSGEGSDVSVSDASRRRLLAAEVSGLVEAATEALQGGLIGLGTLEALLESNLMSSAPQGQEEPLVFNGNAVVEASIVVPEAGASFDENLLFLEAAFQQYHDQMSAATDSMVNALVTAGVSLAQEGALEDVTYISAIENLEVRLLDFSLPIISVPLPQIELF